MEMCKQQEHWECSQEPHGQGRGKGIRTKDKLSCDVIAREASVDPKGSSGPGTAFGLVQIEARVLVFVPQQAVPWKRVSTWVRKLCVVEGKCQEGLSCEPSVPSTVAAEQGVLGPGEGIWWSAPTPNTPTYTEGDLLEGYSGIS